MCQISMSDSPTHSRQFDANCGKIWYVSDSLQQFVEKRQFFSQDNQQINNTINH